MRMVDEMNDPVRQGKSVFRNPDGSTTVRDGMVRCSRCGEIPFLVFGTEQYPICNPCQVVLYNTAYAAFVKSRETPTYVEPPKWWRRSVSPRVEFVVMWVYAFTCGFAVAVVHMAAAAP